MDAETMTNEELSALAKRLFGASWPGVYAPTAACQTSFLAVAREAVRWADERAALRAQAKAEPVGDVCKVAFGGPHFARLFNPGELPVGTKLYTAPPPDHAEALAEDMRKLSRHFRNRGRYIRGVVSPVIREELYHCADDIDAALTRYKERTNG
jgi:hypothetical protein